MLSFGNQSRHGGRSVRREFLRVGGFGLGGLGLGRVLGGLGAGMLATSELAARRALASAPHGMLKDKSVVFLFMHGGPSQYETFDPKMEAPSSIRSATGEIATTLPGITFGGTFERLAQRAHLLNIVRSFVTGDGNHDIKPVLGKASMQANLGSLYSRIAGPMRPESAMPTNAMLFPRAVEPEAGPAITSFGNFESPGSLGAGFAPFVPGAGGGLQQDLQLNLSPTRLEDRRALLASLDAWKRAADADAEVRGVEAFNRQAFDALLRGVSDAFDFSQEDPRTIEQYDTRSRFDPARIDKKWNNHQHYADHNTSLGKLLLLARRLCERGCGFVTVTTSFVWDMHADINNAPMREGMGYVGAPFDHAVSAFIDDLEDRGLRDKILLVCCGEMGRTPQINAAGGRDHWGNLAPLMLYGGGLASGQVIGQSSRDGGTPASDPVHIPDLVATIMHTLLDRDQVRVTGGLPRDLLETVTGGQPISGLGG
jgi:hypothetical protein